MRDRKLPVSTSTVTTEQDDGLHSEKKPSVKGVDNGFGVYVVYSF